MQGRSIMKLNQRTLTKWVSSFMLAGALVALNAARAEAVLIVYACNDIGCVGDPFVADGGGGDTYPAVGSPASPYLNLTYSITAAGFASLGGTPYLYAVETGYTGVGTLNFSADASNPPAGNAGQASLLGNTGAFAFPGNVLFTCVMDCAGSAGAPAAPYYLAIRLQPNAGIDGAASGDATVYLS